MVTAGQPARVLRLVTRLNVGGPARQALLLTKELGERFPTVLAAGRPTESEGELTDPDVDVRTVPLVRPLNPAADARSVLAVRRLLTEIRPALLHTHMAKAGVVGRSAATTVRPRPRTVHTFHGHVLEGYFRPSTERAFVAIERLMARQTDALVAVSTEIRDALLELGVGKPQQFHVIPLGFDLSLFASLDGPTGRLRQQLGLPPQTPLVAVIGRLVPIKEVGTALAVMTRLTGVHLAVVGDGESRTELEARARQLGIADRVHFTGWWSDVAAVLGDVDVVLLTSRNEGTPVSLIEAAAAAKPVVATRVGGVPLVVADGITGHLAPPGDIAGLATLTERLLGDADARRSMGEAARRRALEKFSQDRLLSDIQALYARLLEP